MSCPGSVSLSLPSCQIHYEFKIICYFDYCIFFLVFLLNDVLHACATPEHTLARTIQELAPIVKGKSGWLKFECSHLPSQLYCFGPSTSILINLIHIPLLKVELRIIVNNIKDN